MFSNALESKFRGMFNKAKAQKAEEVVESVTRQQDHENTAEDKTDDGDDKPDPQRSSARSFPLYTERRRYMFNKEKAQRAEELVEYVTRRQYSPENTTEDKKDDGDDKPSPKESSAFYDIGRRRISRKWPRDPNGPFIVDTPPGKTAGNDQPLWGATVLDFYWFHRHDDMKNGLTISTGSKLAAYCRLAGEIEHAASEIEWAERDEADPQQLFPFSMSQLMKEFDLRSQESKKSMPKLASGSVSAKIYPKLETRIPLHLLPQKLIVHDPHGTLRVGSRGPKDDSTTREYKLKLTPDALLEVEKERKKRSEEHASRPRQGKLYLTMPEDMIMRKTNVSPVIEPTFAEYPEAPPPVLSTPEAHIYLDKGEQLGTGHHSHVYRATWEVPRELFEEPYVCDVCFENALLKTLRAEVPNAPLDESEPLGHQVEALLIAAAAEHGRMGLLEMIKREIPPTLLDVQGSDINFETPLPLTEKLSFTNNTYTGTRRRLPVPGVQWTVPGRYCEHEAEKVDAGPMFKVHVAAKLSMRGDTHLANEATNYQSFPGHFFEHWSGYNVVRPLHDPTPALAVVPQFYGYYVPVDEDESLAKDKDQGGRDSTASQGSEDGGVEKGYLSPIMLLEDCGEPIDVDSLNIDDRYECAALLFRMHSAGWMHGSFYPRNVVMSHGDITEHPANRKKEDRRFRLIDFGRSVHEVKTEYLSIPGESWECQKMFRIMNCARY